VTSTTSGLIGGMVGYSVVFSEIRNSYAVGTVKIAGSGAMWVGGLVGSNNWNSKIVNCYADVDIILNGGNNIGGIAGSNDFNATIADSYYIGDIIGTGSKIDSTATSNITTQNRYTVTSLKRTAKYI